MTAATKTRTQTITVDAAALRNATAWVSRILPTRPVVPVLGGVVLSAQMGTLVLSAYNYETAATITIAADGVTDGPVLVPGRLLADVAAHLTGEATIAIEDNGVIVESGRRTYRLGRMLADDYPALPAMTVMSGRIEAEDLQGLLSRAAVAATLDPTANPRLDLVQLVAADGVLTAHSTDRYRAARLTAPYAGADFAVQAPAAALSAAVKGMSGVVSLGATDSHLAFEARDRSSTVGLAATAMLPIRRLFEAARAGGVTVDRAELADAVSAAKVSLDRAAELVLAVTPESVEISASSDRSQAFDVIDATGDLTVTWVVNPAYLSDLLAAMPGERVRLTADAKRPESMALRLVAADAADVLDDTCTFLLVPVRQNGATR